MSERRWGRLAASLEAAGIPTSVRARPYPGGVTREIFFRRPDGSTVEVSDQWWRKNLDVWIGYEVHVADRAGTVIRSWRPTKKRSEVVAAVRSALHLTT